MRHYNLEKKLKVLFKTPRKVIASHIDLENCPHYGRFDVLDSTCLLCGKKSDCFWLMKNDQYSSSEPKALWQKKIALNFAIESISVKLEQWQHRSHCQCHICVWLHQAKQVSLELDEKLNSKC